MNIVLSCGLVDFKALCFVILLSWLPLFFLLRNNSFFNQTYRLCKFNFCSFYMNWIRKCYFWIVTRDWVVDAIDRHNISYKITKTKKDYCTNPWSHECPRLKNHSSITAICKTDTLVDRLSFIKFHYSRSKQSKKTNLRFIFNTKLIYTFNNQNK